ncbi:hypothetical protein GAY31_12785 [Azospirillum brasilense]|nr:hypothetical protein [Azospirillum brasilense]
MAVRPHPGRGHETGRLPARSRGGVVKGKTPLPSAHAQTKFALTRQADLRSAESGERVARRPGEGDVLVPDVPPRATPSP